MRRFRRYFLPMLGVIAAFAVTGGPAFAQTTGAVVGTVADAEGKPLPGVTVEATGVTVSPASRRVFTRSRRPFRVWAASKRARPSLSTARRP